MSKWLGCPTVSCINDLCDKGCIRRIPEEMCVWIPPRMHETAEDRTCQEMWADMEAGTFSLDDIT